MHVGCRVATGRVTLLLLTKPVWEWGPTCMHMHHASYPAIGGLQFLTQTSAGCVKHHMYSE